MRTPKRFICPTKNVPCLQEKPCFSWEERGIPDRTECARWKRKNKEAQFKRTIARLRRIERRKLRQDKLLQLYRARVSRLNWEIMDAQRDIVHEMDAATAWEKRYYRLLHIAHGYCSASTCGQDLEGS